MKHIFSIALFFLSLTVTAGNHRDIDVRHISVEHGLSHYTVNSIYQDEFGFIWIGTMDGLNRYDGQRIRTYKPNQSDSLSLRENNIRTICGDRNGHLYIKGLNSLSEFDMRTYSFKLLKANDVRHIFHDGKSLWVAGGGNFADL